MIDEVNRACLVTRTRRISRFVTSIYDHQLEPFGISSSQFSMIVLIARLGNATRAEIGRSNFQERSTSTRNLQLILDAGWAEEIPDQASGRRRPIRISETGKALLAAAMPAWRMAQAKTKHLLGDPGVLALGEVADSLPTEG